MPKEIQQAEATRCSRHRTCCLLVYGCQMNISDAERMEGQLKSIGYERIDSMEDADLILINTCCVRETAEDKVYGKIGEIKQLKRRNPELIFGITGCMAQKEGEALVKRAPHIDFVLGTNKVHELTKIVRQLEITREHVVDVMLGETELPDDVPVARGSGFSAWVPIMYGCNNFCSYCIVPYVRGRERSRRPEDVLSEVEEAVQQGYKEITLLGQNVNSYGKDHGQADFAELLARVDQVKGIPSQGSQRSGHCSHEKRRASLRAYPLAGTIWLQPHFKSHEPCLYGGNISGSGEKDS